MIQPNERIKRLIAQRKDFKYNLTSEIEFVSEEGELWKFSIQCDEKTPYSKNKIFLIFRIPPNYPYEEPQAWVENAERFMHPNINNKGKICYYGQEKPGSAFHIVDRIRMIKIVLEKPNATDSYSSEYAELLLENKAEWFTRSEKKFNGKW